MKFDIIYYGVIMNYIKKKKYIIIELVLNLIVLACFNVRILEKSIYETFTIDPLFLVPLAIAVTILAIICLIIGLFMDNANIKRACHSFTFSSVVFFLLLLFIISLILNANK